MTWQDRVEALSLLMSLKEKRTGEMKARGCVNGSKQREYIKKEDATSPTVSLESLFIVASINAFENRKVATFDIPGAFLHTETDEDVIMALEGPLAELMVKVDPKIYRKHITTNKKGKALLYVKMNKAVYGMLRSAMLFYKKLRADLEDYGFVVNPYDPCVANMTVKGSQMTVVWHVDDLKVSHADDFEITKLGQFLSGTYNGLSVRRGANHDYLGINFDYSRAESHGEVSSSIRYRTYFKSCGTSLSDWGRARQPRRRITSSMCGRMTKRNFCRKTKRPSFTERWRNYSLLLHGPDGTFKPQLLSSRRG